MNINYNKMDLNKILDQAQFLKCKAFVPWSPLEVPDVIYVMNMNVFFKKTISPSQKLMLFPNYFVTA